MKRPLIMVNSLRFALALSLLWVITQVGYAGRPSPPRYDVSFPDVSGCKTLVCDFHEHTVFSDGEVWPTVRAKEAWRLGLDAFAMTDHLEHQRHKKDIPTNRNRSAEIAAKAAEPLGLLFVKGTEITRSTPPGHYNAIFIKDVDPIFTPEFLDAIEEANKQGAFVFWNHHDWQGKEKGEWTDLQETMLKKKWLHGMEVANGTVYYPRAHQWCLDKGLTMMGDSDIHHADTGLKSTHDSHRTLTLVFAKERTLDGIKEALQKGHTAVWHKEMLIGRKEQLAPLFAECVKFEPIHYRTRKAAYLKVRNVGPVDLQLSRTGKIGPYTLTLPAGSTTLLSLYVSKSEKEIQIDYKVDNFLIAPNKGLPISVKVSDKKKGSK